MSTQQSFTKIEKDILPKFRKDMNLSESTEDVKKFFTYSMQSLLSQALSENFAPNFEDIQLQPDQSPPFHLSDDLTGLDAFAAIWKDSDLEEILHRFAHIAKNRHDHLAKKPEKTEAKIRM